MASIIIQAIKLAPRLLWQSLFQPSKAYDFFTHSKGNFYIFTWSFFFSGLLLGGVMAIPHYLLYNNLFKSILFALAFALALALAVTLSFKVAGAGAGAVAIAFASVVAFAFAGAFAFAVTFAGVFVGAVAVSSAVVFKVASTGTGIIAFAVAIAVMNIIITLVGLFLLSPATATFFLFLSAIGLFILNLSYNNKLKLKGDLDVWIVRLVLALMLLAGGGGIRVITSYEMIIYPFAFLTGYFFSSAFEFIGANRKFKENFKSNKAKDDDVTHRKFGKLQKSTLFWGPIIGLLLCIPYYFNWAPKFNEKIIIAALGFAVMPVFILHVPDYLLCLPLWFYQRRKILKKNVYSKEIVKSYEKSLLFKHEMLYLQLPGLHKIMASLAKNKEIGIKEAVKRINHLYWFTFQQQQAQKAIITLGQDKETAQQYIHFLLEENNLPLVKTLAESNRMADLYLQLFEKTADLKPEKKDGLNISIAPGKFFPFRMRTKEKRQYIPGTLQERVEIVYREMSKEEGYRFNNEIIKTLEAVHKFLTSGSLKDFYEGCDTLGDEIDFSMGIKYFSDIRHMIPQLKKVKSHLLKIESIERFETKRSFMNEQKESLEALSKSAGENFYEPFKHIWTEALDHCSGLISQEIKLLRSSAILAIELKNNEILASEEERRLYFQIRNKGQELSTDVLISVQSDSPVVSFSSTTEAGIDVIEAGTMKEISFPITAPNPVKTTVRGNLAFSDGTKANKKTDFSFPITILKKSVEFKEIKNPYIAGPPLKGDTPLFFGRDDVYKFIDKNVMVSDDHQTIVCHGLRRTGKTSLLYRIESQGFTDKRLVPINIDMQGIDDEKDFYYTLSSTIVEKLSLPAASTVENFSQFKQFLKSITPELGKKIMVLMVDEFEAIQELVESKKISKIIFNNIRHLMQHENKLIFLFCGTHKLEEMRADYWSIFFNTAMYLRISYLKRKDAVRLIKEPVKDQLTYDDLAVEQILKMTGGQPYLTQLICRTLVNDLNENKKRNDALMDDVDDAVEQIISAGTEHFSQHIWDETSLLEHLILSAAAEELTHKQLDFIGVDAIYDKIQPLTGKFSKKQVLETLDKLVSKEILKDKNMRYCFPVNLLRKWITARYPLRKVREEI